MSTQKKFDTRQFFILPKRHLISFILLYAFLLLLIKLITKSLTVQKCPICGTDLVATAIFHLFTIGIVYFLFCWIIHMWKKATREFHQ
ncbi:MAG: hypothetical protein ABIJ21_06240 [Nanoarchaeota archaeon]